MPSHASTARAGRERNDFAQQRERVGTSERRGAYLVKRDASNGRESAEKEEEEESEGAVEAY